MAIGLVVVLASVIIWALLGAPSPVGRGGAGPRTPAAAPPQPTPRPTPTPIPPVRVKGTAISTVDPQGQPQWDLRAETVSVDGTAGTVALTVVKGAYFEAGAMTVQFTAPRGTFFIASRNVTLQGGVRAQAASGRTIEATMVKWTPKAKQIEAIGKVVLRQEGLVIRSDRLVADTALQHSKLSGNIRVTVVE
jgi:LPS export ABC transporter protein LptC